MIRAKPLLLITTFLLGSCVPLTPQQLQPTSITIYNTIEAREVKDVKTVKTHKVVTCRSGDTYIIPDKPNLDDLEDGDDQGVVDRLNDHIDFLRGELKNLSAKNKCGE